MNWRELLRNAVGLGPTERLEESRDRTRIRCELVLKVATDERTTVSGRTINLNSRGATATLKQPVKRGATVGLTMQSLRGAKNPGARALQLDARAIWTRRTPDGVIEAGFEFTGLAGQSQEQVLAFLRQELAIPILDDRNKRKFRRISTRWPVEYVLANQERRQALVKDISPCGCLLLSRYPLLQWTGLSVFIRPEGSVFPIAAQAVVRRCARRPGEDWWEIACPLVEMTESDRSRLQQAIERHLHRRKRTTESD